MRNILMGLQKAGTILNTEGPVELGRRLYSRLWECQRTLLLEYEMKEAPRLLTARIPVEFFWVIPEYLDDLNSPELDFNDAVLQEAHRWLRRGDLCLIGYVQQLPATYLWITFCLRELPAFHWPVGAHHAYIYKTFTRASLRGNALNQAALSFALAHSHSLGINKLFIDVNRQNTASIHAIHKVGFQDVGTFHLFRLGAWRSTRVPERLYRSVAS